jgi:ATP-binding cassette subfamily B protein
LASPSVKAITEVINSHETENQCATVKEFKINGSVYIQNLHFSYNPATQKQLININIHIASGEKVAFVGESGSGKTTLVNVLLGLYPFQQGSVRFDSTDIRDLKLKTLRSQIAIMSQEVFLFNTSLRENIRFARLGATEDEIVEACKKAEIWDFIAAQPKGLDTHSGERGVMLSGGQRQRVGMARLFLRDPKIIILDEPSSSLDVLTEARLFDTMYRNIGNRTLIIIAHRLSTIKRPDKIFVFKNGEITEQGSWDELVKQQGLFAKMMNASISEMQAATFHS